MDVVSWAANALLVYSAYQATVVLDFHPASWSVWSMCVWLVYVNIRGWRELSVWDRRQLAWGVVSAACFLGFLQVDQDFKGWADVYYFCGTRLQYCNCDFRWNIGGWAKAANLWSFVLSAVLGAHKTVIQLGLDGLLPGEEAVTKESFISICWRLIPYWLNNWEQQWGAECSSMMFELPHFAVELLLVLPCVQIICARLKILALPRMRVLVNHRAGVGAVDAALRVVQAPPQQQPQQQQPPQVQQQGNAQGRHEEVAEEVLAQQQPQQEHLAANILKGVWEVDPRQRSTIARLRCNTRMMFMTVAVAALAGFNALYVPLHLEHQISLHPRTDMVLQADLLTAAAANGTSPSGLAGAFAAAQAAAAAASSPSQKQHYLGKNGGAAVADGVSTAGDGAGGDGEDVLAVYNSVRDAYLRAPKRCPGEDRLRRNLRKHRSEVRKMRDSEHRRLIPLVEAALALMRLSCEKFFVLVSVYAAYLLCSEPPGPSVRALIRLNARLSQYIQRTILYSFPAICWAYGAGYIFSTFVSVVFWGGPIMRMYEALRRATTVVRPRVMQDATEQQVERMGGNCAICWGDMVHAAAALATPPAAVAAAVPSPAAAEAQRDGTGMQQVGGQQEQQVHAVVGHQGEEEVQSLQQQQQEERVGADGSSTQQPPAAAAAAAVPTAAAARPQGGKALRCGHAFHEACMVQWLHQCHGQGRTPTCPMCQGAVELEVRYHWPSVWRNLWEGPGDPLEAAAAAAAAGVQGDGAFGGGEAGGAAGGLQEMQREIQALIEDLEPVPFVQGVDDLPPPPRGRRPEEEDAAAEPWRQAAAAAAAAAPVVVPAAPQEHRQRGGSGEGPVAAAALRRAHLAQQQQQQPANGLLLEAAASTGAPSQQRDASSAATSTGRMSSGFEGPRQQQQQDGSRGCSPSAPPGPRYEISDRDGRHFTSSVDDVSRPHFP